MVPYLAEEEVRTGRGGKSVMSCLLPVQFEGRAAGVAAPFANSFPDDVRQWAVANVANYGYPDVSRVMTGSTPAEAFSPRGRGGGGPGRARPPAGPRG